MLKKYLSLFCILFLSFYGKTQLLIPVMNPLQGPSNVCSAPSAGANYTASASNSPVSYQWSVSSPSTGVVIANPTASVTNISFPNTNLTYTLVCTASNSAGTSAPVVLIIKVYETPTVTFSGSQFFCQGSSTNLTASPTIISASSTLSYNWTPSTGLSSTNGPSVNASPNVTTTYSVLLTIATCTNLAMVTITVNPAPSFTPVISNTLFCKLDTQTLTINGNASTYSIGSTAINSLLPLTYSVSGGVLITVIGESNAGCMASASITFSVANCTVGLKQNTFDVTRPLMVYPNPSDGKFFIEKANEEDPVLIYNQIGLLVRSINTENEKKLIITGLSPGIYYIRNGNHQFKLMVLD